MTALAEAAVSQLALDATLYKAGAASPAASRHSNDVSPPRRPRSPPQVVPGRRQQAFEDATHLSASPACSDVVENFLDCYSEIPSASSSYVEESFLARDDMPRASPKLFGDAGVLGATRSCGQHLQQDPHWQIAATNLRVAELRQQLDEVSAMLFAFRTGARTTGGNTEQQPPAQTHATSPDGVAAELRTVLQEVTAQQQHATDQLAAAQERADAAARAAEDAAHVARLVAGMCARAAAAADLEAQWREERDLLQLRLEQAARMGRAMLKHQKEHSTDLEPWRQQLLSAAVSVGCSVLGAAMAVLIIRRAQAA